LLGIGAMAFLAWLSSGSLVDAIAAARRNLDRAQRREKELEQARSSLEEQVRERTRDLESALGEVRQRSEEQRTLLDLFRRQTIPVVPLFRRVIAMSAVGVLDAQRADRLLSSLLGGIQQYDAQIVLLDVTGMSVMDEAAAQALAQAIAGARLVGAECVLVGISPDVASKLVDLGHDLGDLSSRVDMEAGLRYALGRMHYRLSRRSPA
jgi:rsbT co-antagonist protein RsbR